MTDIAAQEIDEQRRKHSEACKGKVVKTAAEAQAVNDPAVMERYHRNLSAAVKRKAKQRARDRAIKALSARHGVTEDQLVQRLGGWERVRSMDDGQVYDAARVAFTEQPDVFTGQVVAQADDGSELVEARPVMPEGDLLSVQDQVSVLKLDSVAAPEEPAASDCVTLSEPIVEDAAFSREPEPVSDDVALMCEYLSGQKPQSQRMAMARIYFDHPEEALTHREAGTAVGMERNSFSGRGSELVNAGVLELAPGDKEGFRAYRMTATAREAWELTFGQQPK